MISIPQFVFMCCFVYFLCVNVSQCEQNFRRNTPKVKRSLQAQVDTVTKDDVTHPEITINGRLINDTRPITTEAPPKISPDNSAPHNITIGARLPGDRLYYTDNTVLENSGPSTIVGTFDINIDGPVNITCVEIWDQVPDGWGGFPSLVEGGLGHNHLTIGVRSQYTRGFHFLVHVFGFPTNVTDPDGHAANIWNTL